MQIKLELISGLPKKELVERLHYHQRQSEISDRAIGFYLLDMEKRKLYRPLESVTVWARKHLPQTDRPDKLLLFARRLEELPAIEAAFHRGEIPWTKTREIARIADKNTEQVWLNAARKLTSRELEEEVRGKKRGDRPGGGLKARRERYPEPLSLKAEQRPIWDAGIRKGLKILPRGSTPNDCAVEMARCYVEGRPAEKAPEEKAQKDGVHRVVLHLGLGKERWEGWAKTRDGRIEIDPKFIAEKILAGAPTITVEDIQGAGVCSAIPFGRRGKVAPGDRDAAVSPELKEAVLDRDECCLVCETRENLSPHHLARQESLGKEDVM